MATIGMGQLLHLRLFLEGVEVPVVSTIVTSQIGAPASAQVEIVPTDAALRLLPRTTVHVFYLDYEEALYEPKSGSGELSDKHYKLLFCGELFSLVYSKSGFGQRSIVLQCLDFSNQWDTNYLYSLRYSSSGSGDGQGTVVAGNQAVFLGTSGAFDDILNNPQLVIRSIVDARSAANNPALSETTDIVGTLFAILELLGGVQGKHYGVNAWATIEERRVRLMDQLAGDSGKSAAQLLSKKVFTDWITDRIGGGGAVLSFRDLVGIILNYIYYDIAPMPVARYVPGSKKVPDWPAIDKILAARGEAVAASDYDSVLNKETGVYTRTNRSQADPEFLKILDEMERLLVKEYYWHSNYIHKAPNGTVFSPSVKEGRTFALANTSVGSYHRTGRAADLGLYGFTTGYSCIPLYSMQYQNPDFAKDCAYGRVTLDKIHGKSNVYPASDADRDLIWLFVQFYKDIEKAARRVGLRWGGAFGLSTLAPDPETGIMATYGSTELDSGRVAFEEVVWAEYGIGWDPLHVDMGKPAAPPPPPVFDAPVKEVAVEDTDFAPDTQSAEPDSQQRERLITQIFRPDVWFVVPPVCNVLFPEEYTTLTFGRQMIREVTRLQLTTFNEFYESAIVNQYYFAPAFEGIESLTIGGIGSASKKIIYPHEKFSGIVPKMERISEISFYSKLDEASFAGLQKEMPKGGSAEDLSENIVSSSIEKYAGQVAAYNFLKGRYQARGGSVHGRFLPRVVCGFPALVVNRPVTSGDTAPTHFLGLVTSVTHVMGQGGGDTSVSLSHMRSHKTGNDIDDLFTAERLRKGNVLSIQAAEAAPVETIITMHAAMPDADFRYALHAKAVLLGSVVPEGLVGPKGGKVTAIIVAKEDMIEVFAVDRGTFGENTVAGDFTIRGSSPEQVSVGGGMFTASSIESPEKVEEFSFFQFKVIEDVVTSIKPLEEAIRPPWFSDEYSNARIGTDIYGKILGCNSLVDIRKNLEPLRLDVGNSDSPKYTGVTIEQAANELVSEYSKISDGGMQANAYIYGTTRREFAHMGDVLGSFHAQAFGNKKGLEGLDLVDPGITLTLPITVANGEEMKESFTGVAAENLDPRSERRGRVADYRDELLRSFGLRG